MTKEEIDERGVRAWAKMAELMELKGPSLAMGEMLRDAPEATSAAIAWLAAQPIERRMALCDEFFGPVEEPRRISSPPYAARK